MDDLVQKKVLITDKTSDYYDEWGHIIEFDGDSYHVAIADGKDSVPIFYRDQFRVYKSKYNVRLYYTAYADFQVEAESEKDALVKAQQVEFSNTMLEVFERMPESDTVNLHSLVPEDDGKKSVNNH